MRALVGGRGPYLPVQGGGEAGKGRDGTVEVRTYLAGGGGNVTFTLTIYMGGHKIKQKSLPVLFP